MTQSEFPDVFADGVSVAGGPFGIALTFQLSDPARNGDPEALTTIARVRMSVGLAQALAEALGQASTRAEPETARNK